MIENFRGDEGFKRLVEEILKQKIVFDTILQSVTGEPYGDVKMNDEISPFKKSVS